MSNDLKFGLVKNPYWKRIQAAKAWQQEHAQTREQKDLLKSAANAAWAARQKARKAREAAKHTVVGQALIRAGLV